MGRKTRWRKTPKKFAKEFWRRWARRFRLKSERQTEEVKVLLGVNDQFIECFYVDGIRKTSLKRENKQKPLAVEEVSAIKQAFALFNKEYTGKVDVI